MPFFNFIYTKYCGFLKIIYGNFTSKNSQILMSEAVTENIHPAEILRQFKADDIKKVLAAHILSTDESKKFEVIAVGDSDLLYDSLKELEKL